MKQRIVSLLPSATEIVDWLGAGDQLVGVTYECTVPASASTLPHVTDTIIPAGATPAEIDAIIRQTMADGGELYTLDRELLRGLEPDLVISQDLCRVCALPAGTVEQACQELSLDAEIFQYDPMTLSDVLTEIDRLAEVLGAPSATADLHQRLASVAARVEGQPRPNVLLLEWTDPPFTPGHWIPDQIVAAGGRPLLAHPGGRSTQSSWDAIGGCEADVLLVAPCGFNEEQAAQQLADVLARPEVAHLPAVVSGRCHAVDADSLIVRPGPRLVDGVETLAQLFHG